MNIAIIGHGRIGKKLEERARQAKWDIGAVVRKDGAYREEMCLGAWRSILSTPPDVAFLAIPTLDDGYTAYEYLQAFLSRDVPVVTCEKGALSNYFAELQEGKHLIGYSATVGGGTRLLRYLEEHLSPNVQEIHAVVNGTLNYTFEQVANGRSLGEVVEETKTLGYAEPGAESHVDVINKEAVEDVPMKAAILFNICNLTTQRMQARDVRPKRINEMDLKKIVRDSNNRRYIVSITRENDEDDTIGGFTHHVGDWAVSAGFKNIQGNPLYKRLIPPGVNNALLIAEGKDGIDGTYLLSGQGAGVGPTTASMMKDARRLVKRDT